MSTKDERILTANGNRYPFKVPEGYFDNLTARIMERVDGAEQNIPTEKMEFASEKKAIMIDINKGHRRNLWISIVSIAASLVLIAVIALKFLPLSTSNTHIEELTAEYTEEDYNEDLMSYTMADNIAVYSYLSGYTE